MSNADLPSHCDVLVVGAGPAGAACALWLARAGVDVVLVDQHDFPRDKVCGDGLIPDAHHALRRLGVYDEVMAAAEASRHVACIGPRGGRIDVPGTVAVLPRRELDDIVCRAAVRAGAKLRTPWRFEAAVVEGDVVVGARLKQGDVVRETRARWVVLATGAVPQALQAADMCKRRTPSGIALRGYVKNDAMVGRIKALEVVWHKSLTPGYGWIFPAPGGRFNIGVGIAHSHPARDGEPAKMKDVNLRKVFEAFCAHYEPARELMRTGTLEGDLKGAPLRCSLAGARYSRPGLLVTGEAAGSTYSFTGEGIGKAYETGLLAAETLLAAPGGVPAGTADDVRTRYEAALAALQPRFDLYERANRVNAHPWLADLLIWRARKSERLLRRMAGVLEETSNPGNLVSVRGIVRVLFPGA
ncbi:NAD(P)/FAD-dependent oxidoreductase [Scleromatobacter humisilvae]|uniref:Geranylgeranyl reductase family protein n=1 Tax=Scleromatobacter humisilvae TaxID=2897159 RepID=A0A9X1YMK8_9BURK|nr:geranylgeranyl reductase family protein [Scleromatobacter humisilvae]MCK9688736.1 geranylgeranyl reductase family protein [Scleromatobacter humisilvae]